MSISEQAKKVVSEFFTENAAADKCISAEQLADLVSRDGKTVRAYLRKIAARDQSELKGARWRINKTLAENVVKHYMKRDAQQSEQSESKAS